VIQSILRYASIAITAILVLSFVMFISDQSASGTAGEVATLNSENGPTTAPAPVTPAPKSAPKQHGEPRKTIDDLAGKLTKPFDGVAGSSHSKWVRKGLPTLIALLLFGFGLSVLAGYLPKKPQLG
jgi:hypothetical protein